MDFSLIRKSIPILELANRLGIDVVHNRAKCFFPERHKNNDRTPSLSFNAKTNTFKCWVCDDVKGSVIDLVMQVKGLNFKGALDFLRQEGFLTGMSGPIEPVTDQVSGIRQKTSESIAISKPIAKSISIGDMTRYRIYQYFIDTCGGLSEDDMQYLASRRIFKKTAQKMGLCSIKNYEEMSALLEKEFDLELLQAAGLFNDKDHLRFYKHRLIVPYYQEKTVKYFQARAIDSLVVPKELNPSGTIPIPYNIDAVKTSALVYLCEGVVDTITLIEQGFPAVGVPGANNFKPEWAEYFEGKRVFSVFDADKAGHAGNERLKALFASKNIYFDIIKIPEGTDINDLFTGKGWKSLKR